MRLVRFFFFNDTATTEIYTLSLHDALPIFTAPGQGVAAVGRDGHAAHSVLVSREDRKSTRLNSSHVKISYAVFCLKKKKKTTSIHYQRQRCVPKSIATTAASASCCPHQ